jgi:hypothetical protein
MVHALGCFSYICALFAQKHHGTEWRLDDLEETVTSSAPAGPKSYFVRQRKDPSDVIWCERRVVRYERWRDVFRVRVRIDGTGFVGK